ncbi:MAG: hypothetical protein IT515_06425 [Burkholderiales bacterium]|nr:hypothetical protein [Burkholderiales bacterium]
MGVLRKIAAALGVAASIVGCDLGIHDLKPGVSTAQEVRSVLGEPSFEWREGDGSVVWEFAEWRAGLVTYMAEIGADGILRALRQVLAEEYFAEVRPGMIQAEIRRLIGKPAEQMSFPARSEEVWTWRYGPVMPQGINEFHVHFDRSGHVVTTSRSRTAEPQ